MKSKRKKMDKFINFMNNANDSNYRDKEVIIRQFNKSVRKYKRFDEIYNAGDEEHSFSKLHEAGTMLYMCCEWALKNYLHSRYEKQHLLNEITKNVKERKITTLSTKKVNVKYLLDELKKVADPKIALTDINCMLILNNAKIVNNSPKHVGTVPDPKLYKESLGEVRKIIKIYVDEKAELDVIDDSIYGDGWYEILENTSDFNSAYSYVLITKRIRPSSIKGLFSLKWDLVIDMDPDSDKDGLAYQYTKETGINPKVRILDSLSQRKKFSYSNIPYWIMANGVYDDPNSIADSKSWGSAHGKYLMNVLEEFHKVYFKPVKAFVYPMEDEKNLRRIIDSFNDAYDGGEEIDFCVLSAEQEYNSINEENFKILNLSFLNFCSHLHEYFQDSIFNSHLLKKEIPAKENKRINLDDNFIAELEDSFETVFIDIDQEDEIDPTRCCKLNFYQGFQLISWYGLRENFDVVYPGLTDLRAKINRDMNERGRLLRKVCYSPGIGGTTLMRRLAWEFREAYPTLILNRLNEQTAKNLQKIYDKTQMPILIFVDNNCVEFDEVKNLQTELKQLGFAFVICYFERKLKGVQGKKDEGSIYMVIDKFEPRHAEQMQSKLVEMFEDDELKIEFKNRVQDLNPAERYPFILSMYAFEKDFKGVKPFIARFLNNMNDQSKKILFALSLADYGNTSISTKYFTNLYNDQSVDEFLLNKIPGINELVRIEEFSGKKSIKIRYTLFGEEILTQLSNGEHATSISFLNLVDSIITFIEDSRINKYTTDLDTIKLLRDLFISRKADVNTEKPAFSLLIMKLQEEHRLILNNGYDYSVDAIVRIFSKLVEVYPEETHFTAHLARFYFYIEKNYEKGFSNIDAAIELSQDHVDPLLYHMKAMGYSSRIVNMYIKQVIREISENPSYDITELQEKIKDDAENAFKYFKIVRDSNIGLAGHISEINLCIQIANLSKKLIEETENFTIYLSSERGKWAMQYIDRAETLWDECKQIATDSASEDLDEIENKLRSLTASLEESIDIWEKYIVDNGNRDCTQARRILARIYSKAAETEKNSESRKNYFSKIVRLMEDNIAEENQHVGNIRIWFDSVKYLDFDNQDQLIQDAIIKLNRWVNLTDAVEAHYYRFILKFIQAKDGSMLAERELPKLLKEMKNKAMNKYNRTAVQHWITNEGKGINALEKNRRNLRSSVNEEEMIKKLTSFVGRISNNYVNDSHAYINWNGVEIFFNPSATKGEISKNNINQRVKFGLGFSYDGPRAYNSSIKLITGNDDIDDMKRELESDVIVKCEVIRNIEFYTQVRIIGFDEELGSIHIDELMKPYSAENRPGIGIILEGRTLREKFDNAKQTKIWEITMNTVNSEAELEEETAMSIAFKRALKEKDVENN